MCEVEAVKRLRAIVAMATVPAQSPTMNDQLLKIPHLLEIPLPDGHLGLTAATLPQGMLVLRPRLARMWADFPHNLSDWQDKDLRDLSSLGVIAHKDKDGLSYVKKSLSRFNQSFGVWLHVTNQCNLRCKYCYLYKNKADMDIVTARQTVDQLFAHVTQHGFPKLLLKFSGGEALLRRSLIENTIDYATRKQQQEYPSLKLEFLVLSNGTTITPAIARWIKEKHIRVNISMDGLGKYNDLQRVYADQRGSFQDIKRGILNLRTAGVPFSVSVTITKLNVSNLPALTRFFLKHKIIFSLNFFRENPHAEGGLMCDSASLIKYMSKSYDIISSNMQSSVKINYLLDRTHIFGPRIATCGVTRNYVVVRPDGKVATCQMEYDHPVAHIADPDWWNKIAHSKKGNCKFAPSYLQKSPCHDCFAGPWCCGGCPILTQAHTGSTYKNSPYCEVYRALIPKLWEIEGRMIMSDVLNSKHGLVSTISSPTSR